MKKLALTLVVLLLLALPAVTLATSYSDLLTGDPAPATSEWDGEYAGHWEAVGMGAEEIAPVQQFAGMDTASIAQLDLDANGAYTLFLMSNAETGTWASAENGVTLTAGDKTTAVEMKNGQLVCEQDGILIYFAKGVFAVSNVPTESPWDGAVTGTWVCIGIDTGNGVYLDTMMGIPAASVMELTLEEGGTMTGRMPMSGNAEAANGTWTGDADSLTLSFGSELQAAIVNGQLRFVLNGMGLVLAKQ